MIEDLILDISGHPLHITRGKLMQCLVLRNQLPIFDKAFTSVFQNWSTLYPTASEFRVDMPMQFHQSFNLIFNEMRGIFSNLGEEVPYDEEAVKDQVIADPECIDWFRLAEAYWERACQIAEQAAFDLGNTPQSNLAGNTGFVGFGIGGMIGAALANTATNLLDRGIDWASNEMKLRKYDKQLDELLHGEKTVKEFVTVASLMAECICDYTITAIVDRTGEECVYRPANERSAVELPQYKSLSTEEKIVSCIAELEKYPAELVPYDELVRLTKGKSDALVEYGNNLLGENYGFGIRREVAEEIYNSAAQMAENTLDEIDDKLSLMKELLDIHREKETVEKEITRLTALRDQKVYTDEVSTTANKTLSMLEKIPIDEVFGEGVEYTNGFFVFMQEIFLSRNGYEKLPDDDTIQRCTDLGNGTPLLIKLESMGLDGKDAIKSWTYWARKGNPYALMRLGLCRLYGCGIEKDVVRSRQLLLKAADGLYIPAAYILYQIAIGKFKPDFGHPTPEDKKYESDVQASGFPEEVFEKYRRFGYSLR